METECLDCVPSYCRETFGPDLIYIIERIQEVLKSSQVEFDTLVGIGLSGSVLVPILARALDKHFLIVRKKGDGSHHLRSAAGRLGRKWVFVDDLTDTGDTYRFVVEAVERLAAEHEWKTELVGAVYYHELHRGFVLP